MIVKQNPYM